MSYVSMSADLVIDRCERAIAHITQEREKRDQAYIEAYCHSRWWRRLFRLPPLTPAQAIESIRNTQVGTLRHLNYPSLYAFETWETAINLLTLAKLSKDGIVHVTAEDWDHIK